MRKGTFDGNYYKFISNTGFSFAFILARSNEGPTLQLILKDKSFQIEDPKSIRLINEKNFIFAINQKDIVLSGRIVADTLHPMKKKVMGPFTYFPFMECKHRILSMYHKTKGEITIDGKVVSFDDGYGYIEGDKGKNFPKHYIWYNSVLPTNETLTLAIAHIPFLFFSFTGLLCFLKTKDQEFYLCTYNGAKVVKAKDNEIVIRKSIFQLSVKIDGKIGCSLNAPKRGDMTRVIKENLVVRSCYKLLKGNQTVLSNEDQYSSCEWVLE